MQCFTHLFLTNKYQMSCPAGENWDWTSPKQHNSVLQMQNKF